jgi:hypothetical protein
VRRQGHRRAYGAPRAIILNFGPTQLISRPNAGHPPAPGGKDGAKSDEEIVLFVRDEETGRFLFNDRAVQALGLDPIKLRHPNVTPRARKRGTVCAMSVFLSRTIETRPRASGRVQSLAKLAYPVATAAVP